MTSMASVVASWVQWLSAGVLRATWQASVLIVVVLAVQWALRRRLSSRWRYNLWLLVVVRLMLPVTPASPVSVFNLVRVSPKVHAPPADVAETAIRDIQILPIPSPATRAPAHASDLPLAASRITTIPPPPPPKSLDWHVVAAYVWLGGALVILARIAFASVRLARRVRTLDPITDPAILEVLAATAREMGVTLPPAVRAAPFVSSPGLLGVLRPRLLVPPHVIENFDRAELRLIFLHELAHLRRRDVAMNWLLSALLAVHWFNPLVWLAAARVRGDRELACDELALSVADGADRDAYGQTILKLLQALSPRGALPRMVGILGILETGHPLKRRIAMIAGFTRVRRPSRWTATAAVIGMALLATVMLTDRVAAEEGDPSAPGNAAPARTHAAGERAAVASSAKTPEPLASDPEAATAASLRKLKEVSPTPFKFDKVPLGDVLDFFRDVTKLNVFVNWPALESAGIPKDTTVTLNLNGVTYEQALQYVVRQILPGVPVTPGQPGGLPGGGGFAPGGAMPFGSQGGVPLSGGLDFAIEAGVLNVSTREDLARYYKVKIYELPRRRAGAAATQPAEIQQQMAEGQQQMMEVMQLIMQSVSPQSWAGPGAGTLRPFGGTKLVISTSEANHQQIANLLKELGDK